MPNTYNNSLPSLYYNHKGKTTASHVGSPEFDLYLLSLNSYDYTVGTVPAPFAYRPDLTSNLWFGSHHMWWKLMMINGWFDPFESLTPGASILVPKE